MGDVFVSNYLIIRMFIGGVSVVSNDTSVFAEILPPLQYVISLLFIPPKSLDLMRKFNKISAKHIGKC